MPGAARRTGRARGGARTCSLVLSIVAGAKCPVVAIAVDLLPRVPERTEPAVQAHGLGGADHIAMHTRLKFDNIVLKIRLQPLQDTHAATSARTSLVMRRA